MYAKNDDPENCTVYPSNHLIIFTTIKPTSPVDPAGAWIGRSFLLSKTKKETPRFALFVGFIASTLNLFSPNIRPVPTKIQSLRIHFSHHSNRPKSIAPSVNSTRYNSNPSRRIWYITIAVIYKYFMFALNVCLLKYFCENNDSWRQKSFKPTCFYYTIPADMIQNSRSIRRWKIYDNTRTKSYGIIFNDTFSDEILYLCDCRYYIQWLLLIYWFQSLYMTSSVRDSVPHYIWHDCR